MVRNFIYCASSIISLLSIVYIICAIINKNKRINKYIIIVNITNILYLIIINFILPKILPIILGDEMIIFCLLAIISGIIYLLSIIICRLKFKKIVVNKDNKNVFIIPLILIVLPIIFFMISLFREIYLINNSTILLSHYVAYENDPNGSLVTFVYSKNDRRFKEISFDIHDNQLFLPKKAKEISISELENLGFNFFLDGGYINIYKDDKRLYKAKAKYVGNSIALFYNE